MKSNTLLLLLAAAGIFYLASQSANGATQPMVPITPIAPGPRPAPLPGSGPTTPGTLPTGYALPRPGTMIGSFQTMGVL